MSRFSEVISRLHPWFKPVVRGIVSREWSTKPSASSVINDVVVRTRLQPTFAEVPTTRVKARLINNAKQVLVDRKRIAAAAKRGRARAHLPLHAADAVFTPSLEVDLAVRASIARLATIHPRPARVISMQLIEGLKIDEIASALAVPATTVDCDLSFARQWLSRELSELRP